VGSFGVVGKLYFLFFFIFLLLSLFNFVFHFACCEFRAVPVFLLRVGLEQAANRKKKTEEKRNDNSYTPTGVKMFFFLTLRESPNGSIEPDILPSSSSTQGLVTPKSPPRWSTSPFRSYITTWDFSDRVGIIRRFGCMLAFMLHTPLNVISMLSWGVSLLMFVGILLSLLNLVCVGAALWKLDVMKGERAFYGWRSVGFSLFSPFRIFKLGVWGKEKDGRERGIEIC
jgi:hypothetical protein